MGHQVSGGSTEFAPLFLGQAQHALANAKCPNMNGDLRANPGCCSGSQQLHLTPVFCCNLPYIIHRC
jgi:hypothetical protein